MRTWSRLALFIVGCVGCSSSKKPGSPPPDAAGEACGDTTCKPPEQCIDVHGRHPGPPSKECWIPCAVHPCPDGMVCDMIYDGPGKVCLEPDPNDPQTPRLVQTPPLPQGLPDAELTLWRAFGGLVNVLLVLMPAAVIWHGGRPGVGYLKRTNCRIDVYAHGVELRDGQGALLGETANGTLRVARANLGTNRGMYGAVSVEHGGGKVVLTPPEFVGAYPGLPSIFGTWRVVPEAMYQLLLRFAA